MDTLLLLLWLVTAGVPVKVESETVAWSVPPSPFGGGMPTELLATV